MTHTRIIRLMHRLLVAKHKRRSMLSASGLLLLPRLAENRVFSEPLTRLLACAAVSLDDDFLLFEFLDRGSMLVSGIIAGVSSVQF